MPPMPMPPMPPMPWSWWSWPPPASSSFLGISVIERVGREQQRRDARRVLQRRADDLRRVDDARRDHVAVLVLVGVVAVVLALHLADAVDDHRAVDARVLGDVPQRVVEHLADDRRRRASRRLRGRACRAPSPPAAAPRRRRGRRLRPAPPASPRGRLRAAPSAPSSRSRSRRRP